MKKLISVFVMIFSLESFAHEGAHGPEQKLAPHGGVLRDGASLMLELVKEGSAVKVFPLTHEGKPIEAKSVDVDSKKTTLTDARKKPVTFKLVPQGNAFLVEFEKGSSHRYSLVLVGKYQGKENKAKWQIELGSE